MNKSFTISMFVLALAAFGCKKKVQEPVYDTSFKASKTSVYLKDSIALTATKTDAAKYDWDFGDGSAHASDTIAKHVYTQPGTYTVTLKIGTSSSAKRVRVFPGDFSYQLKNSLDRDVYTYQARITDYVNTNEYFYNNNLLAKGSTTDTIFVSLIDDRAINQLLVDGTIYSAKGVALKVGTGIRFNKGEHTLFEIKPSTSCNVYSVNGTSIDMRTMSVANAIGSY